MGSGGIIWKEEYCPEGDKIREEPSLIPAGQASQNSEYSENSEFRIIAIFRVIRTKPIRPTMRPHDDEMIV